MAKVGPTIKDKTLISLEVTVVGSKAVTNRNCGKPKIERMKFSKIVYTNGPVKITKIFLLYKLNTNPIVATITLINPFPILNNNP